MGLPPEIAEPWPPKLPICQLGSETIPFSLASDRRKFRVRMVAGPAEETREKLCDYGGKGE
jgi:hypothetical protein